MPTIQRSAALPLSTSVIVPTTTIVSAGSSFRTFAQQCSLYGSQSASAVLTSASTTTLARVGGGAAPSVSGLTALKVQPVSATRSVTTGTRATRRG